MWLSQCGEPFDSDQQIFELKIDEFRALAHIEVGLGKLISRKRKRLPHILEHDF
jgi:hypothetical protein